MNLYSALLIGLICLFSSVSVAVPVIAAPATTSPSPVYSQEELVARENQAMVLIRNRQFTEASTLLLPLASQYPASDTLNYLLAQCASQLQNNREAIAYYKKISPQNEAYPLVRTELARTYALLGETSLAKKEFNEVLASNPPPALAASVQKFLAILEAQKSVNVRTAFGYVYDSNVNSGPDDIITHGTWTLDQKKHSDSGTHWELGLDFIQQPNSKGQGWQTSLSYENTSYFTQHNYSWQSLYLSSGPMFQQTSSVLFLPLTLQNIYIGGQEYNRSYGLSPQWQLQLKANQLLLVNAALLKQEYPSSSDRNGHSFRLEIADRIAPIMVLAVAVPPHYQKYLS